MTNARPLNRHATGQLLAFIKRPIETFDQDLSVYRLAQETYCSGLDGACANGLVLKCAQKNNRCVPALSTKDRLQLHAAHAGELHVGNQARRLGHVRRSHELFSGFKCTRGKSEGPHEVLRCHSNGCIILNNRDHWHLRHNGRSFAREERTCLHGNESHRANLVHETAPGNHTYVCVCSPCARRTPRASAFHQIGQRPCAHFFHGVADFQTQPGSKPAVISALASGLLYLSHPTFEMRSALRVRPSRPGEFHPEPLTDPDVTLSRHPARAIARRLPPSAEPSGSPRYAPVRPSSTAMAHPLRSTGITPLQHYYGAVRPSPAQRYFRARGWSLFVTRSRPWECAGSW